MTRVLVTGAGSGGHGEQILKSLNLERGKGEKLKYLIFGADANQLPDANLASGGRYFLPSANEKTYIPELMSLAKHLSIDAIFHGSEPEMKAINLSRETFETAGIILGMNSQRVIELCLDKKRTMDVLESQGHRVPKSKLIQGLGQIPEVRFFPVVVKPRVGGGGSRGLFICQTAEDLRDIYKILMRSYGSREIYVQEYVGTETSEVTIGVLSSRDGDPVSVAILKRNLSSTLSLHARQPNLTNRADLGDYLAVSSGVSQGKMIKDEEIESQALAIARSIDSKGPINIQGRMVDGQLVIFEINPRFSGTTSARAVFGVNEVDLFLKSTNDSLDKKMIHTITRPGLLRRELTERTEFEK